VFWRATAIFFPVNLDTTAVCIFVMQRLNVIVCLSNEIVHYRKNIEQHILSHELFDTKVTRPNYPL
jgi:hypothetical protein